MSLEPPPRIVDKFVNIWRDWLYFFWEFVDSHTGGSTPTPPATGTSWNAHGNTAIGDASNFLKIENASLLIEGTTPATGVGNTPAAGAGTRFMFIPSKGGAIRSGVATGTEWDAANIGASSIAIGSGVTAPGSSQVVLGKNNAILNTTQSEVCIGSNSTVQTFGQGLALGGNIVVDGILSCVALGSTLQNHGNQSIAIGTSSRVGFDGIGPNDVGYLSIGNSIAIGSGAICEATQSVAFGPACQILSDETVQTGKQSVALGYGVAVAGNNAVGIGSSVKIGDVLTGDINSKNCIAIGNLVGVSLAENAMVIGSGFSAPNRLINTKPNSLWMGINSDTPTFIFDGKTGGAGTTGFIGIVQQNPISTLDVGGSVGFKYDLVTATNGGNKTLTEEYVVFVDMAAVTLTNTFIVNLPDLGATTIDRRIYYIKFISTTGNWPPSTTANSLQINPGNNDGIEEIDGGAALAGQFKSDGVPLNFSFGGGSGNRGAALTLIADNDLGGWWVI